MWFTDAHNDQIDSIAPTTPVPTVTLHDLPSGVSGTLGEIVLGPDGNLYAGLSGTPSYVLQITPAGVITPFALPAQSTANPDVLAVGPDKLIWIEGGGMLTSMSTAGVFTDYAGVLPATDAFAGIAADPAADALWLTDRTASTIYRVALARRRRHHHRHHRRRPATRRGPAAAAADGRARAGRRRRRDRGHAVRHPRGCRPGSAATSVDLPVRVRDHDRLRADDRVRVDDRRRRPADRQRAVDRPCHLHELPLPPRRERLLRRHLRGSEPRRDVHDRLDALAAAPGVDVGAEPISGTVRVKLPGQRRFTTLTAGELIPLGRDARYHATAPCWS